MRLRIIMETERIPRRQDAPPTYALNGAVYVGETEALRNDGTFLQHETVAYPMPKERAVDVDDEVDMRVAAAVIKSDAKPCSSSRPRRGNE